MSNPTSSFTLEPAATAGNPLDIAAELLRTRRMRRERPHLQVALGVTEAWSFDVRRRPLHIEVLEGEVMVTCEGDAVDHVLSPGDVFTAPRGGRVAVAAFRPSRFGVTAP